MFRLKNLPAPPVENAGYAYDQYSRGYGKILKNVWKTSHYNRIKKKKIFPVFFPINYYLRESDLIFILFYLFYI